MPHETHVTRKDWLAERAAVEKKLAAHLVKARERNALERELYWHKAEYPPIQWCLTGRMASNPVLDGNRRQTEWEAAARVDSDAYVKQEEKGAPRAKPKKVRRVARKKDAATSVTPLVAPAGRYHGKNYNDSNAERQRWLNTAWMAYAKDTTDRLATSFLFWNIHDYTKLWFRNRQSSPTNSISYANHADASDWVQDFMVQIVTTIHNGLILRQPFANYLNRALHVFVGSQLTDLKNERDFQKLYRESAPDELDADTDSIYGPLVEGESYVTGLNESRAIEATKVAETAEIAEAARDSHVTELRIVPKVAINQWLKTLPGSKTEKGGFLHRVTVLHLHGGNNGNAMTAKEIGTRLGVSPDKIDRTIGQLKKLIREHADEVVTVTGERTA